MMQAAQPAAAWYESMGPAPSQTRDAWTLNQNEPDRRKESDMALVEIERDTGIMVIRLNRPERMNALSM